MTLHAVRRIRYTAVSVHRVAPVAFLCLVLAGCVSQPDIYAPPAQRKPLDENLSRLQPMLEMSNPMAEQFFVQDIAAGPQTTPWRWTGKRPTVRIALRSTSNYRMQAVFAIADTTFKATGPVTVTFYVNDQLLESVKYDSPGTKTFDQPIPMHLLKPMSDNTLAADIDKTWAEKKGDPPLGVILVRIGLVQ